MRRCIVVFASLAVMGHARRERIMNPSHGMSREWHLIRIGSGARSDGQQLEHSTIPDALAELQHKKSRRMLGQRRKKSLTTPDVHSGSRLDRAFAMLCLALHPEAGWHVAGQTLGVIANSANGIFGRPSCSRVRPPAEMFFARLPPAPADDQPDPWKNLRWLPQRRAESNTSVSSDVPQEEQEVQEKDKETLSELPQEKEQRVQKETLEKVISNLMVDIPQILHKEPNWDSFTKDFKVLIKGQPQVTGLEAGKLLSGLLRRSFDKLDAEGAVQVDIRSIKEFTRDFLPRQTFVAEWQMQWDGPPRKIRRWEACPVSIVAKTTFHINDAHQVDFMRIESCLMNGRECSWPDVELVDKLETNLKKVEAWAKDKALRN